VLVIGAIGYGQGKSITGIFDGQLEDFLAKIQPTLGIVQNLWNLVQVPMPLQAMVTSNGMTGFSAELAALLFNALPKHVIPKNLALYVIESTNLAAQTETQKLDIAFKVFLRVGLSPYHAVQVKMVPLTHPQGGLGYDPHLLILYDLRGIQIIENTERFHDSILSSNDITDLQRFDADSKAIYRSKEKDLEGGSWVNLNLSQLNRELMLGFLSGKDYEKDIRSVVRGHVFGLNQFLLSDEQARDESLISKIIYNVFTIVLLPIGFKDVIRGNALDHLKALILQEFKICETPFKTISFIEFPVQTPYLLTEATIFPSVVISEYLKNASLALFHHTANWTFANVREVKKGVHPLKKFADEILAAAKKRAEAGPQFRDIYQTIQTLCDSFVSPIFDYMIAIKNGRVTRVPVADGEALGDYHDTGEVDSDE
jgi:hypothetical protein